MTVEETRLTMLEILRQENMKQHGFGPSIMREIRVCTECGTAAPVSELKCRECGKKLPRETLYQQYRNRHRFCARCDTVVANDVQFCPECGTRIQMIKPLHIIR